MSEQSPEKDPEKERKYPPLTDNCDGCSKDYPITSYNSHVWHFGDQPECDFILCVCPHCQYKVSIFVGDEVIDAAIHYQLPMTVERYASDRVHESWLRVNGLTIPKTYELNPRHEALVAKFGETITAMPPEIFWDNIDSETGRPYPESWV